MKNRPRVLAARFGHQGTSQTKPNVGRRFLDLEYELVAVEVFRLSVTVMVSKFTESEKSGAWG
jgi:hypothetical protein